MKSKLFYLLLAKNSSENKTELESETIPYTFKSNGHRLRNYRIYGNSVERKNLAPTILPQSSGGINIQQIGDGIYSMSGTSQKQNNFVFTLNLSLPMGDYKIVNMGTVRIALDFKDGSGATVFKSPNPGEAMSFSYPDNAQRSINVYIPVMQNDTVESTVKYMIIRASEEYNTYEPYIENTSVGDLVTEGEHAEKYCVPITVEGKNIYNPLTEWYLNNTDNVSAKTDSSTSRIKSDIIKINNNRETIAISGLPSELSVLKFRFYDIDKNSIGGNSSGNIPSSAQYVSILCGGENLSADTKTLIKNCSVQLEYGNQSTAYEPYVETQTVNIYLDEPIAEGEYIDFRGQKQYFADETSENVSLPAIPTIDGTNILSVATETQPSKIYLQGNITEIETVSAQALQANIQSLQPISLDDENLELDVMPIDRSEFQINDISEVPVEDENPVEEIPETENFETSGDEENAE